MPFKMRNSKIGVASKNMCEHKFFVFISLNIVLKSNS